MRDRTKGLKVTKTVVRSGTDKTQITRVKGGWVKRDTATGQFMEVQSERGKAKATAKTESVIKKVSWQRHEALQRLANR